MAKFEIKFVNTLIDQAIKEGTVKVSAKDVIAAVTAFDAAMTEEFNITAIYAI